MSDQDFELWEQDCSKENDWGSSLPANEIDYRLGSFQGWHAFEYRKKIKKTFDFYDMKIAFEFEKRVLEEAGKQKHYPKVSLEGTKCNITLFTPSCDGLTDNDFIMAAKIDRIHSHLLAERTDLPYW